MRRDSPPVACCRDVTQDRHRSRQIAECEEPAELDDLLRLIVRRLTGQLAPEIIALLREALPAKYAWPGNVRELEQAVRRILLTRQYTGDARAIAPSLTGRLQAGIGDGSLDADELLAGYCKLLHERHATYEEVARRTNLDRRTVKAYIEKQTR